MMPAAMLKLSGMSAGRPLWLSLAFRKGATSVPSGTLLKFSMTNNRFTVVTTEKR
jgi:hypothetical protein